MLTTHKFRYDKTKFAAKLKEKGKRKFKYFYISIFIWDNTIFKNLKYNEYRVGKRNGKVSVLTLSLTLFVE